MLKSEMKKLALVCICFFVCFFAPIRVQAEESITGGETLSRATEINWNTEYITTNDDGWFKLKIPENLYCIGAGYDSLTEIVGRAGTQSDDIYHVSSADGYVKLGEYTEYWDTVGLYATTSDQFCYYYSDLSGEEYAYFHVYTDKADHSTFHFIYGSYATDSTARDTMSLNQDYTETFYRDSRDYGINYKFTAANTGNYKVIIKSDNGKAECKVTYKDGTLVPAKSGSSNFVCERNQTTECIISVTKGAIYYLCVKPVSMSAQSTLPMSTTVQVSNTPVSSISLNSNALTMNKGEQFQLAASVLPDNAADKSVTYYTSNPNVALVSEDGLITAAGGGTATVTVDSNDGSGVQAFCQVTVIPKLVTRLDLNKEYMEEDLATCYADEYRLYATVYPIDADNQEVTFTSSAPDVVSVDAATGQLMLEKPGTAIITCTTNDGSNLSKTCKITLKQSHFLGEKKTVDGIKYKVTSDTTKGGTVAVYGVSNKKAKSYTIRNTISIDGYSYKITAVNDKAFVGCKNVTKIILGTNIKSIGKEAFYNCKKLKTITLQSKKIKTVGKNAFKNIYSKANIKVPSSCLTKYKKLFKGKGQKSSVKIKKI